MNFWVKSLYSSSSNIQTELREAYISCYPQGDILPRATFLTREYYVRAVWQVTAAGSDRHKALQ